MGDKLQLDHSPLHFTFLLATCSTLLSALALHGGIGCKSWAAELSNMDVIPKDTGLCEESGVFYPLWIIQSFLSCWKWSLMDVLQLCPDSPLISVPWDNEQKPR